MEQQRKFESAQEEMDALRAKVSELESVSSDRQQSEIIREVLKAHVEQAPDKVLGGHKFTPEAKDERIGRVAVKAGVVGGDEGNEASCQEQINELLQIAEEDGILNAVSIVRDLDPHMEDAFHDALVKKFQESGSL